MTDSSMKDSNSNNSSNSNNNNNNNKQWPIYRPIAPSMSSTIPQPLFKSNWDDNEKRKRDNLTGSPSISSKLFLCTILYMDVDNTLHLPLMNLKSIKLLFYFFYKVRTGSVESDIDSINGKQKKKKLSAFFFFGVFLPILKE